MADGKITVPPDSTGKNVETREVTRPTDGLVVERQVVVAGDGKDPNAYALVTAQGESVTADLTTRDLLLRLLQEIQLWNLSIYGVTATPPLFNPEGYRS